MKNSTSASGLLKVTFRVLVVSAIKVRRRKESLVNGYEKDIETDVCEQRNIYDWRIYLQICLSSNIPLTNLRRSR